MSLDSFSIFRGKNKDKIDASTLTPSMLNELRLGINYQFYSKLSQENKARFHAFLWNDLHDLWLNENSSLKIPIVTTVGHILVYLVPFGPQEFMDSLLAKLKEFKSYSILYFSCFCYISEFYTPKLVAKLIRHYKIFNLISIQDSSTLPKLTESIIYLPIQVLHSLLEYYFKLAEQKADNPYLFRAAKIIVSQDPHSFSDFIKPDISLTVCDLVFADNFPKLRHSIVKSLSERSLKIIQDSGAPLRLFSSACRVLNALILTKQVPEDIVHGIFTAELIQKSVSMEDLLILPIEPEIVCSIYGNQDCLMSLNQTDTPIYTQSQLDMSTTNISLNEFNEFDSNTNSNHEIGFPGRMPKDVDFLPSIPLPDQPKKSKPKKKEEELNDKLKEESEDLKSKDSSKEDLGPSAFEKVTHFDPTLFEKSEPNLELELSNELDLTAVPPPQMPILLTGEAPQKEETEKEETKLDLSSPINQSKPIQMRPAISLRQSPPSEKVETKKAHIGGSKSTFENTKPLPSFPNVGFSPNQITSSLQPQPRSSMNRRKSQVAFKMPAKSLREISITDFADYLSSQSAIDLVKINPKFVVPLINYFKRFPEYSNELCNIMLHCLRIFITPPESSSMTRSSTSIQNFSMDDTDLIDPKQQQQMAAFRNEVMYAVLKAITETQSDISSESLNYILFKIFWLADNRNDKSSDTKKPIDIALKMKILDMIGTLRADKLTKPVANQMQHVIDQCSIAKEEILQKKAKRAFINLYEHTSTSLFKFFFDMYVQKLDVFDSENFPRRLSFISNVLHHIHGEWSISFSSMTTLFGEIITMFNGLHRNVILDIFTIMTIFVSDMKSQSEILPFIKIAIKILEANYVNFTGKESFTKNLKSQFIDNSIPEININIQFDTDIISNPKMWHRRPLKCAKVAYSFLSRVPWTLFKLSSSDKQLINRIIMNMVILLPKETDDFLILLNNADILNEKDLISYVTVLATISHKSHDVIAYTRLYCLLVENHPQMSQIELQNISDSIKNLLSKYKTLQFNELVAIKNFLVVQNIPMNEKIYERPFDSKYMFILQQKQKNDKELLYSQSTVDSSVQSFKNDDSFSDDEDHDIVTLEDNDLASLIFTLTPLIYANLDIPPEFLQSEKVMHFCTNSTASIDEDQMNQLFEFALKKPNAHRMLFYILRYSYKNSYKLNLLEDSLDHPIISLKKLFPSVFLCLSSSKTGGFASLSPKVRNYIRRSIKTDLVSFVLNALPAERVNATLLLKFDPSYFLERFEKIHSFTKSQLINICIYIQTVKFPFENFFKFVINLFSIYGENPNYRNLVHRILTVSVLCYGSQYKQGAINLFNLLSCELGDMKIPVSESSLRQFKAAEFLEFCFSVNVISNTVECQQIAEFLSDVVKPSNPYFYLLRLTFNHEVDNDLFQKGINALLPSTRATIVHVISDYLKKNPEVNTGHDFLNNLFKIFDNFANPILINPLFKNSNHRILTAMTFDSFAHTMASLMTRQLSGVTQRHIFNSLIEQSSFTVNSATYIKSFNCMKRLTMLSNCPSDLICDIYNKCKAVVNTNSIYANSFLELYFVVAQLSNKIRKFNESIKTQLQTKVHYQSSNLAGNFGLYLMQTVNDVSEANTILNFDIPHFYVLFNALVSIEKKNRSMVHTELQKRFTGVHLMALEMLNDPKFRIFAPLLALIEHDQEIPKVLKDYLDSIQDKIQRVHVTDYFHEF